MEIYRDVRMRTVRIKAGYGWRVKLRAVEPNNAGREACQISAGSMSIKGDRCFFIMRHSPRVA